MFNTNYKLQITVLVIIIYITAAFFKSGFPQPDEHYQIIEFAELKTGNNTPDKLSWEYQAQIRPTLQIGITYLCLQFFRAAQVTNPFHLSFLLRLLTALLSFSVIFYFIKNTESAFTNPFSKNIYYLSSYLFWNIPFISVRFSSETWGGLFFLLALAVYLHQTHNRLKLYILGSVMALSFLLRFQMAFAILGFVLWILFIKKEKISFLYKFFIGFTLVLLVGSLIDRWFYGEWVFTPWNYFYVNIIEGRASSFGKSPFYYYLIKLISVYDFIIGIPLLIALVFFFVKKPKNMYLWILTSFLFFHSIISHKEYRFIFPIFFLFPIIFTTALNYLISLNKKQILIWIKVYFSIALLVIFIKLAWYISKPAGKGQSVISEYIYTHYKKKNIRLLHTSKAVLYGEFAGFYHIKNINEEHVIHLCQLKDSLLFSDKINLLLIKNGEMENSKCQDLISKNRFVLVKESPPSWTRKLYKLLKGHNSKKDLLLYKQLE